MMISLRCDLYHYSFNLSIRNIMTLFMNRHWASVFNYSVKFHLGIFCNFRARFIVLTLAVLREPSRRLYYWTWWDPEGIVRGL